MKNEELVERIQAGNEKEKYLQQLFEQNFPFIKKIASKYSAREEFDDLIQEGYIGLHTAAMKYDPECGVLFLTYASYWIHQKMIRYLKKNLSAVRIPDYMAEMVVKYKKISSQFQKEYGREPSEEEYKEFLDVDDIKFYNIQRAAYFRDTHSLNESMSLEDDSFELENLIPAEVDVESDVIHKLDHDKMSKILWGIIAQLPEKKQIIMKMRAEGVTLKETGNAMGITEKQVSRVASNVRRKIRLSPAEKDIREYYMQYV